MGHPHLELIEEYCTFPFGYHTTDTWEKTSQSISQGATHLIVGYAEVWNFRAYYRTWYKSPEAKDPLIWRIDSGIFNHLIGGIHI